MRKKLVTSMNVSLYCLVFPWLIAENIPPSITGGARIDAYLGKLVVYRIQVEDLDDFNVTLETTGNTVYPADYNFTRTYKGDHRETEIYDISYHLINIVNNVWFLFASFGL